MNLGVTIWCYSVYVLDHFHIVVWKNTLTETISKETDTRTVFRDSRIGTVLVPQIPVFEITGHTHYHQVPVVVKTQLHEAPRVYVRRRRSKRGTRSLTIHRLKVYDLTVYWIGVFEIYSWMQGSLDFLNYNKGFHKCHVVSENYCQVGFIFFFILFFSSSDCGYYIDGTEIM